MFELREVTVIARSYAARPWCPADDKPGVDVEFYRPKRGLALRNAEYNKVTPSSFRRLCRALEGTYDGTVTAQVDGETVLTHFDVR